MLTPTSRDWARQVIWLIKNYISTFPFLTSKGFSLIPLTSPKRFFNLMDTASLLTLYFPTSSPSISKNSHLG